MPSDAHINDTHRRGEMVELGAGDYVYETTGEDWGNLQDDAKYKEATANVRVTRRNR